MKISAFSFLFFLLFSIGAAAQNPFHDTRATRYADSMAVQSIQKLSLKEKLNEMAGPKNFYLIAAGSMLFGKRMPVTPIGGNRKKRIPAVYFTDGPRGIIHGRQTSFPTPITRAATWNTELEHEVGIALGKEARGVGGTLMGTPCMNILRHPANGRAQESFGEDPVLTGKMAWALASGIQRRGVMACAKHFALNSIEDTRYFVDVQIDDRSLHEVYLPHFKYVVDRGVATIMSAYNKVNGTYCGENEVLLKNILRKEWNFKGFIHSDWDLGTRSTAPSIKAGMNVEMMVPKFYSYKNVKKDLESGILSEQDLDSLIYPTLFTKFLFQYLHQTDQRKQKLSREDREKHKQLSLKVAEEGVVLLKNEDNFLPINNNNDRILVTGYLLNTKNDGDHGSSYAKSPYVITPKKAFKKYAKENHLFVRFVSPKRTRKLEKACTSADKVIVLAGYYHDEEGEYISTSGRVKKDITKPSKAMAGFGGGGDRHPLTLKERDEKLIRQVTGWNRFTAVHVTAGSAVIMENWKNRVPSILWSGYYGMEGAHAIPKVVFGEVNPSGKLPFSIPVDEADLPHFPIHTDTITYGFYHGYTLLDKLNRKAAFPFGYGLSYTEFDIQALETNTLQYKLTDTIEIRCTVKNTGKWSGAEVVQVYAGKSISAVERHKKNLRAFTKIYLNPGESKHVVLQIPVSDLAYYHPEKKDWEIEMGDYELYIGNSSDARHLQILQVSIVE
ncbi:MAG: glycoside hydrolase family 3 C-terminal domain-containing protein [Flavobacteriales bacterium]|nr:glycoside hydrolase family 3 C-terminal domain-containing protein [Flavobacteriales bacterium]